MPAPNRPPWPQVASGITRDVQTQQNALNRAWQRPMIRGLVLMRSLLVRRDQSWRMFDC
jgi:hypothetical protein